MIMKNDNIIPKTNILCQLSSDGSTLYNGKRFQLTKAEVDKLIRLAELRGEVVFIVGWDYSLLDKETCNSE